MPPSTSRKNGRASSSARAVGPPAARPAPSRARRTAGHERHRRRGTNVRHGDGRARRIGAGPRGIGARPSLRSPRSSPPASESAASRAPIRAAARASRVAAAVIKVIAGASWRVLPAAAPASPPIASRVAVATSRMLAASTTPPLRRPASRGLPSPSAAARAPVAPAAASRAAIDVASPRTTSRAPANDSARPLPTLVATPAAASPKPLAASDGDTAISARQRTPQRRARCDLLRLLGERDRDRRRPLGARRHVLGKLRPGEAAARRASAGKTPLRLHRRHRRRDIFGRCSAARCARCDARVRNRDAVVVEAPIDRAIGGNRRQHRAHRRRLRARRRRTAAPLRRLTRRRQLDGRRRRRERRHERPLLGASASALPATAPASQTAAAAPA